MYVANHYVRIKGHLLSAGEPIPEDLPQANIDWLLRAEAIRKAKRPAPVEEPALVSAPVESAPVEEPTAEPVEEPVEDLVVEIDSMAGIVTEPEAEQPKKKRKGAAKS